MVFTVIAVSIVRDSPASCMVEQIQKSLNPLIKIPQKRPKTSQITIFSLICRVIQMQITS